jgi:hypothetical protein
MEKKGEGWKVALLLSLSPSLLASRARGGAPFVLCP